MIIANLPYMIVVSDFSEIKGGVRNNYYENRAGSLGFAYADGGDYKNVELRAATLTSVYIKPGISQAGSSSEAGFRSIHS